MKVFCTLSQKEYVFQKLFNSFKELQKEFPNAKNEYKQVFDGYGTNSKIINIYTKSKNSRDKIGLFQK